VSKVWINPIENVKLSLQNVLYLTINHEIYKSELADKNSESHDLESLSNSLKNIEALEFCSKGTSFIYNCFLQLPFLLRLDLIYLKLRIIKPKQIHKMKIIFTQKGQQLSF
jgi:hypothetical protein